MRALILISLSFFVAGCPSGVGPGGIFDPIALPVSDEFVSMSSVVASFDWAGPFSDMDTDFVPILSGPSPWSEVDGGAFLNLGAPPGALAGIAISLNRTIAEKDLTIDSTDPMPAEILPLHRIRVVGIRISLRGQAQFTVEFKRPDESVAFEWKGSIDSDWRANK